MAEFNPDLHAFLLENETCMWAENGEMKFGIHVAFCEIVELIDILGDCILEEGGIECNLNNKYTLYVPLEDHFMNNDYRINHYKHCFDTDDLERCKQEIEKFDSE